MNKLIVIPARGGSKGIPKKNIYPLKGKPLLAYTIEVVISAELDSADVVVSTDSEEIKKVALNYSDIYVVDRPENLASDNASTEDALLHALDFMEHNLNKKYEAVLTLQPTSPFRKKETLRKFIKEYEDHADMYDALLSLSEDRTDFWITDDNGKFERLYRNAPRRRQERRPLYKENSAYYITNVKSLRETHSVLGNNANGFLISEIEGIDINEPDDLIIAEAFMNCNDKMKRK
jgi:CMP-N-acetylneuraminic acid synthetase